MTRVTLGLAIPGTAEIATAVMPGAEHVISFHAILSGSCWAALSDGSAAALNLNAGDVVVFPGGAPNVMSSEQGSRSKPDMAMYYRPIDQHLPFALISGGEGKERTRFVCGYLGCDARPFNPLLAALPPMLRVGRPTDGSRGVTDLFSMALQEGGSSRPGGETVLAKLSELMFVEVIRSYIETLPIELRGWLSGLRDPHVGKALRLIHARPAEAWSLDRLAREAGLSRTVFAERFSDYVGVSPLHYLKGWRFSWRAGCSNKQAPASRGRQPKLVINPRRPSIAPLRSLLGFPQGRGGREDCCRPNTSPQIPFSCP